MKKMLSMMLVMISLFGFISCTEDEDNEDFSQPTTPTLQLSDICGVWVNPSNSLYYIAIYPSGKYTYCFNNELIGSGKCSLNDNTLCLNDDYTYKSDLITVNMSENKLTLYGNVTKINLTKEYISQQFIYSSESLSPSIIGVKETSTGGLNKYYNNLYTEISFISDLIFEYVYTGRHRNTYQYKTIAHYIWRYVYREPYTYGIKLNQGDGLVEIYDFSFTYSEFWGLDLNLEQFRVQ